MKENFGANEEYEIRLGDVFWSVMRRWRGLIIAMIIFGILIGLFGAVREYRRYTDPAANAKKQEEYESSMEQYQRSKDAYEAKIDNLKEWIGRLDFYKENSLMLLMDPYDICKSTLTYYVDTGYEIMPGVTYQNPNYTGVLVDSYASAISRLPFDDLIDLRGGPDLTTAHTVSKYSSKKVCTVETDTSKGILKVTVICDTEERSRVILQAVRDAVTENEALLTQVVGEHTITVIGETSEHTLDLDLANMQTTFTNEYESNTNELTKTEELLNDLEAPVKTVHSKRTIVKQGIKYGILGLVIGLILSVLYYIFKDHDRSVSGLQRRYGIPVLGAVRTSGKKAGRIDRKIASRLGLSLNEDSGNTAAYIGSAIRAFGDGEQKGSAA